MKMKNKRLEIKNLTKNELVKLAEQKRNGDFALSFYLGLKSAVNFKSEVNSVLSGEMEKIKNSKEYSGSDKKKILAIAERIKKEISFMRLSPKAMTLVFFAGEKSEITIYRIPIFIRSKIVIGADYYIHPLIEIMEEFPRYLVVAVDRDRAEFFNIFLGRIDGETEMIISDVPKKIRTSISDDWHGRREQKIERHIEDHLKRHYKAVASKIREYLKDDKFDYLVLGGHRETEAKIREFLDKKSIEKLIGFFNLSHQDHNFIEEKSLAIIKTHEKSVEEKIVRNLLSDAGDRNKKWAAVLGIDSVIKNISRHNVSLLVVGHNYQETGYICTGCNYFSTEAVACAAYGGKMEKAEDLVDAVIAESIRNKIKIEQLFFSHKDFDRFGIGAILKSY